MNERIEKIGLQDWMLAGKERHDHIPLEVEDEWLDIDYEMLPLGKTKEIWGSSEALIANVEREAESKVERGNKHGNSRAVIAQLVQSFYIIGCLEKMVKRINGVDVSPSWFQMQCSQSLGSILQVWMNAILLHRPYPKPAWLLRREGRDEEAKVAATRGMLRGGPQDPHSSSPDSDGEDGEIFLEPYSAGDGLSKSQ